jgi:transcriptional regulator with XRE-family HTH domain
MPTLDESRLIRHREFDWHVGTNIRYLRIINDLEQKELARLVDMDAAQLSRVESGQRSLKFKEAIAIAKVLGVTPQRLGRKVTVGEHSEMGRRSV